MIGGLLSLAIIGAVFYLVSRAASAARGGHRGGADLRETVGRFFRLGLLLAAVVLSAEGIAGVLAQLRPGGADLVRNTDAFARSLAFTVVGLPVLAGLVTWNRRRMAEDPDEARAVGWALYVNAMLCLALVVGMGAWFDVLRLALGSPDVPRLAPARALTWSAAWAAHWVVWRRLPTRGEQLDAHLVFGSAAGLVTLTFGVGLTLTSIIRSFYDAWFLTVLAGDRWEGVRERSVTAVLGGIVWGWHWVGHASRRSRTSAWHAYVLLVGVLGGITTTVVGAALLLHSVLQWIFGDPGPVRAAGHFVAAPGAAVTVAVGAAVWAYHRRVLGDRARAQRGEVDRVYDYLAGAVGLVVAVIAATIGWATTIDRVAGPVRLAGRAPVANGAVLAVTLGVVGVPVWAIYWRSAQRRVGEPGERDSVTRRVYLVALFGVAAAIALVALVVALILGFEDLADGEAGLRTLFRMRVPLGLLATMGAVAGYHALIYRADRAAATPTAAARPRPAVHELLVVSGDEALVDALRRRFGDRVRHWRPAGEPERLDGAEHVVEAIEQHPAAGVLVIDRPDGTTDVVRLSGTAGRDR